MSPSPAVGTPLPGNEGRGGGAVTAPAAPTMVRSERRLIGMTIGVALGAWALLAAASRTPAGDLLGHHGAPTSAGLVQPAAFAVGWLAMVAAMMLPPSVRFVLTLHRLLAGRVRRTVLLLTGIGGFTLVWLVVGGLFQVGDRLIHSLVHVWPWLDERQYLLTASTLALAGLYQLAPVKLRCLRGCRNPAGFVAKAWQGRAPGWEVLQVGVAYGWSCVGCCWALMLLMFAAGLTSLWLMVALTAVMVLERRVRRVELAVPALGGALVLTAVLVAGRLLPGLTGP